ncbi:ATP-binding cassette domain-containing protein, partial [Mycobacterium tuberculosis]|nr:ATP-binding cassette domain-containing protein [Mycobacterium tuberculosis]
MTDVNKWYGDFHVLRDINLTVMRGERIVICGPSGSGKSTMIRCINRLEEHQKGQIIVDGIELTSDLKRIDEIRRDVGMVFIAGHGVMDEAGRFYFLPSDATPEKLRTRGVSKEEIQG